MHVDKPDPVLKAFGTSAGFSNYPVGRQETSKYLGAHSSLIGEYLPYPWKSPEIRTDREESHALRSPCGQHLRRDWGCSGRRVVHQRPAVLLGLQCQAWRRACAGSCGVELPPPMLGLAAV